MLLEKVLHLGNLQGLRGEEAPPLFDIFISSGKLEKCSFKGEDIRNHMSYEAEATYSIILRNKDFPLRRGFSIRCRGLGAVMKSAMACVLSTRVYSRTILLKAGDDVQKLRLRTTLGVSAIVD